MIKRLFSVVCFLLVSQSAQADLQFKNYSWARSDPDARGYLVGFTRGMLYTNSLVKVRGGKPLFCPPRSFRTDEKEILAVVDGYVNDSKPAGNEFVEQLILDAFVRKFPCEGEG